MVCLSSTCGQVRVRGMPEQHSLSRHPVPQCLTLPPLQSLLREGTRGGTPTSVLVVPASSLPRCPPAHPPHPHCPPAAPPQSLPRAAAKSRTPPPAWWRTSPRYPLPRSLRRRAITASSPPGARLLGCCCRVSLCCSGQGRGGALRCFCLAACAAADSQRNAKSFEKVSCCPPFAGEEGGASVPACNYLHPVVGTLFQPWHCATAAP